MVGAHSSVRTPTVVFLGDSDVGVTRKNIQRALDKKNRSAEIIYVYQKPELAWEFVLARETVEGRNIPCKEFIRQFYASKATVCQLKGEFQERLQVDVLIKDTDGSDADIGINLSAEEIDELVRQPYHPDQLEQILTGAAL